MITMVVSGNKDVKIYFCMRIVACEVNLDLSSR